MSTNGLILSCIIDATEGWDAATADIPGDFLQTDHEKGNMHIQMKG